LQDILHLGSDGRMNTPAAAGGNWAWRYAPDALHSDFAIQLAALMEMTDRDGSEAPREGAADAGKPTDEAHLRAELGAIV
jgi:4-alpha-glucanotransferase